MVEENKELEERKKHLRQAFGAFATGVTVVTTISEDESPIGFTANSFTSVSLDPPLLLVCIAKSSLNYKRFTQLESFAVNILGADQKEVSGRFASKSEDRFAYTKWTKGAAGNPIIDGVVAWFECKHHEVVESGDHAVIIGQVTSFHHNDKRPLAYLRGHYLDLGLGERAADSVSLHGGVRLGCVLEMEGQVLLQTTPDGWGLPMGRLCSSFRESRISLDKVLADEGLIAELGFLYSVFDAPSGNATWMFFQGSVAQKTPLGKSYRFFPISDLPLNEIAVPEVCSILRRFQSESKESRFGLYIDGSAAAGQVNHIEQSGKNWSNYIKEQK